MKCFAVISIMIVDVGTQYRCGILYLEKQQEEADRKLVKSLKQKGFDVNTETVAAEIFLPAKEYHQDYYYKTNQTPYCHTYKNSYDQRNLRFFS